MLRAYFPSKVFAPRLISALVLVIAAVFLVSACGRETSILEENSKDYIYKVTDIPLIGEGEQGYAGSFFSFGDTVCVLVNRYGPDEFGTFLMKYDAANDELTSVPMSDPDTGEANFQSISAEADGTIYAISSSYAYDEETGEESNSINLLIFDPDGGLISRSEMTPDSSDGDYYYYIDSISCLGDGRLIGKDNGGIFVYDTKTGEKRVIYEAPEGYFDASIKVLNDGTVFVGSWGDNGYVLKELDVDAGTFSEEIETGADIYIYSMFPGVSHDAYYYMNSNLYYFDRKNAATGKVMDMVASDLLLDDIGGLAELSDSRLAILASSWGDQGQTSSLKLCEHVPASEVEDKEEITLSCVWANSNIMRMAVDFNEKSDKYRIRIVDYSQYESEGNWNYPYTKLNTDIISGYIPDILIIDEQMPIESYIGKDILRDMTPFIEEDEELKSVSFMDNIFDAYRIDGRLYQFVPSFMVYTGISRSDIMGDRKSVTMKELEEVCNERGISLRDSFGAMTRDNLLSILLYIQGSEYIDLSTGRCAFDSPGFIELLELVKQFPTELADDAYEEQQRSYREGRTVMMLYALDQFSEYSVARYGYFGTDISMIGIPGSEGSSSVIMPQLQIAITTSSKYPEAAWEFVREFLLEDYQDKLTWGFPVRLDSLKRQAEKSKEKNFYINENGEKEEYDETWWIAGQEVVIPPLDDEETETVMDFLKGCNRRVYINSTVTDIITEESAAFFEGQKSAEDVAKIIQSRAQIYVHENR